MTFEVANFSLLGFDFSETDHAKLMTHFEAISDAFFSFPIPLPGFAYYKVVGHKHIYTETQHCRCKVLALSHIFLQGLAARREITKMILEKRSDDGRSLLDCLIADKSTCPEEITSLTLELMFGGNQTIASIICASLITLNAHPKVVAEMREEVTQYCQRYRTSVDNLSFEDIHSLPYVGDVARELLRLKPSIAGGFPKNSTTAGTGGQFVN